MSAKAERHLRNLANDAPVLTLSARSGDGLVHWLVWLRAEHAAMLERVQEAGRRKDTVGGVVEAQVVDVGPGTPADFERWLQLFSDTLDQHYRGPYTEKARRIAAAIAANMAKNLPEQQV